MKGRVEAPTACALQLQGLMIMAECGNGEACSSLKVSLCLSGGGSEWPKRPVNFIGKSSQRAFSRLSEVNLSPRILCEAAQPAPVKFTASDNIPSSSLLPLLCSIPFVVFVSWNLHRKSASRKGSSDFSLLFILLCGIELA